MALFATRTRYYFVYLAFSPLTIACSGILAQYRVTTLSYCSSSPSYFPRSALFQAHPSASDIAPIFSIFPSNPLDSLCFDIVLGNTYIQYVAKCIVTSSLVMWNGGDSSEYVFDTTYVVRAIDSCSTSRQGRNLALFFLPFPRAGFGTFYIVVRKLWH